MTSPDTAPLTSLRRLTIVGFVLLLLIVLAVIYASEQVYPPGASGISVRGRISWSGQADFERLDLSAKAEWSVASGGRATSEGPRQIPVSTGQRVAEYSLDPAMEMSDCTSLVERVIWAVTERDASRLRPKTYVFSSYTVSVTPPPGWTVTPKEIVVSADTTNADFVLTKVSPLAEARP